ncbi:hypothetical protein BDR05DRAFT_947041 [Suillus weaverae]|nr:hypothetical protein BDR05DRAFT_947041 [Suillus weaverae]
MSSRETVAVTGIWTDDQNTIQGNLLGSSHTVAMAVGILQNHISKHVSKVYCLEPPMDPLAIQAKYFPDTEPSDSLSVCRSTGLTALFTPNAETKRRIKTQLAQKAQADQTSAEPSTTVATDTATTSQSSTSTAPPRKSKKAKKRNTASAASTASTADHPQVTMDSQLKEMLASMQNEIAEIRGKNESILSENESIRNKNERILNENGRILNENERILTENGSMRGEIETMRSENRRILNENERILDENGTMRSEIERILNENERIDNDLTTVRKDLDAARAKHTQDVEALREVSHHVTSPLASSRPTRPCTQKGSGAPRPRELGRTSRFLQCQSTCRYYLQWSQTEGCIISPITGVHLFLMFI